MKSTRPNGAFIVVVGVVANWLRLSCVLGGDVIDVAVTVHLWCVFSFAVACVFAFVSFFRGVCMACLIARSIVLVVEEKSIIGCTVLFCST